MSDSLTPAEVAALAARLWSAETVGEPIPPLTDSFPDLTPEDSYRIQQANVARRQKGGARVVGHKIGLTARAMQEMLGVSEPDYGHIFDEIVLRGGDTVRIGELIAPRVEPEIAFVLSADLVGDHITADQVMSCTSYVAPSLEIIDSRIVDWRIALVDTIADNASCARIVLGDTRTAPFEVDLPSVSVVLELDGSVVQEGTGAAVLGHPAEAVAWLANAVAAFGVTLRSGHIILPGSMTKAVDIGSGQRVRADFGPLGTVEIECR